MTKRIKDQLIILTFIIFFIITLSMLSFIHHSEHDYRILGDDVVSLNNNWKISTENLAGQSIDLPADLDLDRNTMFRAERTLPNLPKNYDHVLVRSQMQDVTVSLNGEVIHQKIHDRSGILREPLTSTWELIYLPDNSEGNVLAIELLSETDYFSGLMNDVKVGTSDGLIISIFFEEWLGLFVFLLLFSAGMICIVISFTNKLFPDNRVLYIGLTAIAASLWILSEARLLQFITGNPFLIGSISFLMIPIMGGLIALYIKEAITKRYQVLFQFSAVFHFLAVMIILILQQLGISPFIQSLQYLLITIVLIALIEMTLLLVEWIKYKNTYVKRLFHYFLIILVSLLFETFQFYTEQFHSLSLYLRIGLLLFFTLMLWDCYNYISFTREQARERKLLKKLAFKDLVTGGLNRTAYEQDLQSHLQTSLDPFRFILFDLNNLKYINDYFGHTKGDQAIKAVHDAIKNTIDRKSKCYRMGGDEFSVLSSNTCEDHYKQVIQTIRKHLKQVEQELCIPLDVAIGSDLYLQETWRNYSDFYHHVDQLMYSDKKKRKEITDAL
ncbi:diguanylate cyclase (GGDEF)-like protein [Natronobacillus azotifigens]|uniref:Diguanylate cyclase n=1 Tax=Natronobacillus azotifigens TaxID=472978 RepID=A0A9J6REU2_9BACI|nr:diguanylate cyclase [Natronobacillus azotifigens]MCZ0703859.1 diguanylate cyclase [Natronobacillus azotifigens]